MKAVIETEIVPIDRWTDITESVPSTMYSVLDSVFVRSVEACDWIIGEFESLRADEGGNRSNVNEIRDQTDAPRTEQGSDPANPQGPPGVTPVNSIPQPDHITLKAAQKLTALSKGYLSKLCSEGTLRTNGIKGRGLRISAASLAEFMDSREEVK